MNEGTTVKLVAQSTTGNKTILIIDGYGRRCQATCRIIDRGLQLESIEAVDHYPVPLEWEHLVHTVYPDEDGVTRAVGHSVLKNEIDTLDLVDISENAYSKWMDLVDQAVLRWSVEKPHLKASDIPIEAATVLPSGELRVAVTLSDGDGISLCIPPHEWKWRTAWQ